MVAVPPAVASGTGSECRDPCPGTAGVGIGQIELLDRPNIVFVETPGFRWRRSTDADRLDPVEVEPIVAHTGLRAAFEFPDGSVVDWVLSRQGWRSRLPAEATRSLRR